MRWWPRWWPTCTASRPAAASSCTRATSASLDKPGKLRLMYEANLMSFIVEQAGGAATNGHQRILDVRPGKLHERVSVILGSKNEVERDLVSRGVKDE